MTSTHVMKVRTLPVKLGFENEMLVHLVLQSMCAMRDLFAGNREKMSVVALLYVLTILLVSLLP